MFEKINKQINKEFRHIVSSVFLPLNKFHINEINIIIISLNSFIIFYLLSSLSISSNNSLIDLKLKEFIKIYISYYIFLEFIAFNELKDNCNNSSFIDDDKFNLNNKCKRKLIYSFCFIIDSALFPIIKINLGIFIIIIILSIRREKKRRESINFIQFRGCEMIWTSKKNGSFDEENVSNETVNLKGVNKIINEYNTINVNGINKHKKIFIKNSVNLKLLTGISNFLLFINIWNIILSKYKILARLYVSYITLKVKGTGDKRVFNSDTNQFEIIYYPNEVYINGIKQSTVKPFYKLNKTYNFVVLLWNNSIKDCKHMFNYCPSITEIDVSNFDTSGVNDIGWMFCRCHSLISINLSGFDTSQVTNMRSLFNDCRSLISLNLSNFNTSKVTTMIYMFQSCFHLSSLDLSNFDTSQVNDMQHMFHDCRAIRYINMANFNDINLQKYGYIFTDISKNIVICINENLNTKIINAIRQINCSIIDCSNVWVSKQKKIINESN